MTKLFFVPLAIAAQLLAATDYFPLQVGNQWVLQSSSPGAQVLNIEVLRSQVRNGQTWFLVSGYAPGRTWLRQAPNGAIAALDESTGAETILAQLEAAAVYRTAIGGCEQEARPAVIASAYHGANFDFENALSIRYQSLLCADIGFSQETYAPGVGLVQRSLTTFRGEVAYELVWARVNGSAVLGKSKEIVLHHDFDNGSNGWLAGFTDYNLRTSDLRRIAELRPLPAEVNAAASAYFVQGMNRSDDLFMFLKKEITAAEGLEPNQPYNVTFDIRFASNEPSGCFGAGGSPGDAVWLKAGTTMREPIALLTNSGDIQLSVDKGNQSQGGRDAGVAGVIANGSACEGSAPRPWMNVRRTYAHPEPVPTGESSDLWVFAGTDSGYEGLTALYYQSITVRLSPAVSSAR